MSGDFTIPYINQSSDQMLPLVFVALPALYCDITIQRTPPPRTSEERMSESVGKETHRCSLKIGVLKTGFQHSSEPHKGSAMSRLYVPVLVPRITGSSI